MRVGKMEAQAVSNIIWSCGALQLSAAQIEPVLGPLGERAFQVKRDFIPQHLANMLWAAAILKKEAFGLVAFARCLIPEMEEGIPRMKGIELANTVGTRVGLPFQT